MTHDEIKRKNLIKMGFTCEKCGLIYEDGHPRDGSMSFWAKEPEEIKDTCNNSIGSRTYASYRHYKTLKNYNLFKIRGKWYRVRSAIVDKFIRLAEIEEALIGSINYPTPVSITRQVDIFTTAEKLGLPPPLNSYQNKRAKSRAFVERIKG